MSCTCNASGCDGGCNGSCGCRDCCSSYRVCEPAVLTACETLGVTTEATGVIVEDSAFCKKVLENPETPSLLTFGDSEKPDWQDGSASDAINLSELQQQTTGTVPNIVAQKINGDLTGLTPLTDPGDPAFQVLIGTQTGTIYFGQLASVFPSGCGLLYKDCVTGEVKTLTLTEGDIISVDANGNPIVVTPGSVFSDVSSSIETVNLEIVYSNQNVITVTYDFLVLQNASNLFLQSINGAININRNTVGANGLDTGSPGTSKLYWIYAIYNPTTSDLAGLASLSATSPVLPSGYTYYRKIGGFLTDFLTRWDQQCFQKGNIMERTNVNATGFQFGASATPTFTQFFISADMAVPVLITTGSQPYWPLMKKICFATLCSANGGDVSAKQFFKELSSGTSEHTAAYKYYETDRTAGMADILDSTWLPVSSDTSGFYYQICGTWTGGAFMNLFETGYEWNFI